VHSVTLFVEPGDDTMSGTSSRRWSVARDRVVRSLAVAFHIPDSMPPPRVLIAFGLCSPGSWAPVGAVMV
jgi:hypothetical protein